MPHWRDISDYAISNQAIFLACVGPFEPIPSEMVGNHATQLFTSFYGHSMRSFPQRGS